MARVLSFTEPPSVGASILRAATVVKRPSAAAGVPDQMAVVPRLRQDLDRLAAYDRVCGFTLRDQVPPTWLHVLTFGLQTELMAQRDFPFALAGLVHARNSMTLHRPVSVREDLHLQVHADHVRPHRRGATFEMIGEVRVGSELVWSGASTYLARGAQAPQTAADETDQGGSSEDTAAQRPESVASQKWRLPADLGRQYARVSGDVNPIHLWPATARLFGFRTPIVHGMWTHARSLAALEGRLPDAYRVEVTFTKPVPLPSTVGFTASTAGSTTSFGVLGRGEAVHLAGVVHAE